MGTICRFNEMYNDLYDFHKARPTIETFADGAPRRIHYHDNFRRCMPVAFEDAEAWDKAYTKWTELVMGDEFRFHVPTAPNDMVFYDNYRWLHSRLGQDADDERVL